MCGRKQVKMEKCRAAKGLPRSGTFKDEFFSTFAKCISLKEKIYERVKT